MLPDKTLLEKINTGQDFFIDDHGHHLKYDDVLALAEYWAEHLVGRQLVLLCCQNTVLHVGTLWGLCLAGHVPILISDKLPQEQLSILVDRYQVNAILCAQDGEMVVEKIHEQQHPLHPDLGICLSTSGSTGSPKLVRLSQNGQMANAASIAQYLDLDAQERPLAHLPIEYSFGLSVIASHAYVGATVRLTQHTVMEKSFWQALSDATSLAGVPFHFEMYKRMRIARADLPNMRTLLQAGGKMSPESVMFFHDLAEERGWKFHVMYGQTEAGPRISWLPHEKVSQHPDAIGQAIPGVTLSVEEGELVVNAPSVMLGYAETVADLSRGDDLQGVLHTGDLAEAVGDGIYKITGRKNRMVKVHGNRVNLTEVEQRLMQDDLLVYCVGRDDVMTLFTSADTELVRTRAVHIFALPPRSLKVVKIAEAPRTLNGKIDYAKLLMMSENA